MRRSMRPELTLLVALSWFMATGGARAQSTGENHLDALPRVASSTPTVTPIYSQLLLFSMPSGFSPVNDSERAGKYLQQSLPGGQNLDRWVEMIAVTGEKDAATSGITAKKLAEVIAGAARQSCPTTFSVASFGAVKVERQDGFATVIACGTVDPVRPHSRTLLLITIQGTRDLYTLQWVEHGAPSSTALVIDPARWRDRLSRLAPVRLCDVVPNEAPPYPSCTGRR